MVCFQGSLVGGSSAQEDVAAVVQPLRSVPAAVVRYSPMMIQLPVVMAQPSPAISHSSCN